MVENSCLQSDSRTVSRRSQHDPNMIPTRFLKRARTLKRIPAAARGAWAQVLVQSLSKAVQSNTVRAWTELLMLPKTVLCPPPRRGKKHRKAAAAYTLDRLSRWTAGERKQLWEDMPPVGANTSAKSTVEARRTRAVALAREGFDRKACAALVSSGILEASAETLQELRTLHPQSAPVPVAADTVQPPAPSLCENLVAKALQAFPSDAARGPSGLRA